MTDISDRDKHEISKSIEYLRDSVSSLGNALLEIMDIIEEETRFTLIEEKQKLIERQNELDTIVDNLRKNIGV